MIIIAARKSPLKDPLAPPPPRPRFCPNPECPHHSHPGEGPWFAFRGSRKNKRHGLVWYYLCYTCERSFSSSSFLISYYEKINISYDKILSFAKEGISLRDWAEKAGASPGALKLRLCKIGCVLLEELSRRCLPAAGMILARVHEVIQEGQGAYRALRELILLSIHLLEMFKTISPDFPQGRAFLSSLLKDGRKNLFCMLRLICCRWCYRLNKTRFYHTKYQRE